MRRSRIRSAFEVAVPSPARGRRACPRCRRRMRGKAAKGRLFLEEAQTGAFAHLVWPIDPAAGVAPGIPRDEGWASQANTPGSSSARCGQYLSEPGRGADGTAAHWPRPPRAPLAPVRHPGARRSAMKTSNACNTIPSRPLRGALAALVGAILMSGAAVAATPTYRIVLLPELPDTGHSAAYAISDAGQIVGAPRRTWRLARTRSPGARRRMRRSRSPAWRRTRPWRGLSTTPESWWAMPGWTSGPWP